MSTAISDPSNSLHLGMLPRDTPRHGMPLQAVKTTCSTTSSPTVNRITVIVYTTSTPTTTTSVNSVIRLGSALALRMPTVLSRFTMLSTQVLVTTDT